MRRLPVAVVNALFYFWCGVSIGSSAVGLGILFDDKMALPTTRPTQETASYPDVPLATIAAGKFHRPRACVTGVVSLVNKEADGDWHIRLEGGDKFIILEIVPDLLPLSCKMLDRPRKGDKIKAWGIVRYDGEHLWWELHPLVCWEIVK